MDASDIMHVLSRIGWGLARPLNLIVLLLVIGPFLYAMGRRWLGRSLSLLGLATLVAGALLPIGQSLLITLENRYPAPTQLPDRVDGIVLLGGAVDTAITRHRGQPAVNEAGERLLETLHLARLHPGARIVVTGGVGALLDGGLPEAAVMEMVLTDQAVSGARVQYEPRSRNTYENALFAKPVGRPKPGEIWLLVTSANHMPRAMGVFEAQGWPVMPYPVDFRSTGRVGVIGIDALARLTELDTALKEWVGLGVYYWLGRTDALFPGPPESWGKYWTKPVDAPPKPGRPADAGDAAPENGAAPSGLSGRPAAL